MKNFEIYQLEDQLQEQKVADKQRRRETTEWARKRRKAILASRDIQ